MADSHYWPTHYWPTSYWPGAGDDDGDYWPGSTEFVIEADTKVLDIDRSSRPRRRD